MSPPASPPSSLHPTIDPQAARRWLGLSHRRSPWLHEEIGRRMVERLAWIRLQPERWVHWEPVLGGLQTHAALLATYPQAACFVDGARADIAMQQIGGAGPSWNPFKRKRSLQVLPANEPVDMWWANMFLHHEARPADRLSDWNGRIRSDGFLMFSCLGPDTLKELRAVHEAHGWPPPTQAFVDMHDWGDLLVQTGFAEPVMDTERLVLTYASMDKLLDELRGLGRNLHPARFAGLRSRHWGTRYREALQSGLPRSADGQWQLSFEIIYGHAFKPQPRIKVAPSSAIALDDMRSMLRGPRGG